MQKQRVLCSSWHCICYLIHTHSWASLGSSFYSIFLQCKVYSLSYVLACKAKQFFIQWWPFYAQLSVQGFSFCNRLKSYREGALQTGSNVCLTAFPCYVSNNASNRQYIFNQIWIFRMFLVWLWITKWFMLKFLSRTILNLEEKLHTKVLPVHLSTLVSLIWDRWKRSSKSYTLFISCIKC